MGDIMGTPTETNVAADLASIDRVREAHVAALNDGDTGALVDLFAAGGIQMPPNAPANVGRESIRQWCAALLAPFRVTFSLAVDEVRIAGDWAFERGRYRIALHPRPGGDGIEDNGKYVTIYERRNDDGWRIGRDIWNSDNPPPQMG